MITTNGCCCSSGLLFLIVAERKKRLADVPQASHILCGSVNTLPSFASSDVTLTFSEKPLLLLTAAAEEADPALTGTKKSTTARIVRIASNDLWLETTK
ncbi:hypothetical protein [Nitrososphaera sp.]|uniref:hypothetical protein n=1 Tax=Nitrososphaera sp. TaxID=1971748 RepID=UPI00307E969F